MTEQKQYVLFVLHNTNLFHHEDEKLTNQLLALLVQWLEDHS